MKRDTRIPSYRDFWVFSSISILKSLDCCDGVLGGNSVIADVIVVSARTFSDTTNNEAFDCPCPLVKDINNASSLKRREQVPIRME
jgi:hypothetical protein